MLASKYYCLEGRLLEDAVLNFPLHRLEKAFESVSDDGLGILVVNKICGCQIHENMEKEENQQ